MKIVEQGYLLDQKEIFGTFELVHRHAQAINGPMDILKILSSGNNTPQHKLFKLRDDVSRRFTVLISS